MRQYIQYLIDLFWGQSNEHTAPSIPPYKLCFLNLPLDIIFLISDHLELHDKFFLSQTCRPMRVLYHEDWKVDDLSYANKLRFWTGIAHVRPHHWTCNACCELHPMGLGDTPRRLAPRPAHDCLRRIYEPACSRYLHHDIQLAFSLHHAGHRSPLGYFNFYFGTLMIPVSHQHIRGSLKATHSFRPKIVEDIFILLEEWTFKVPLDHAAITLDDIQQIVGGHCSHLLLPAPSRSARKTTAQIMLEYTLAQAFANEGFEVLSKCPRCPTDLSFRVTQGARHIVFRAWRDYSANNSPIDTLWVARPGIIMTRIQERLSTKQYPGSVRAMYYRNSRIGFPHWRGLGL